MKLTIEANTDHAFITAESGHDVARIERITEDGWPDLEPGNYLSDEAWQELIDSLHAPMHACHGLPLPPDIPAGAVAALVAAAQGILNGPAEGHVAPDEPDSFENRAKRLDAALALFTGSTAPPVSPEVKKLRQLVSDLSANLDTGDYPENSDLDLVERVEEALGTKLLR